MSAERFSIVGPPGAGKTTTIKRQLEEAAERYGAGRLAVASLTRAAIAEIVGRDIPVPSAQARTLHGLAYGALGGGLSLATGRAAVVDWNLYCAENGQPALQIPIRDSEDPDDRDDEGEADWQAEIQRNRSRMLDPYLWTSEARSAYALWCAWKNSRGHLDFTDLIERAATQTAYAPGAPEVLFVDEAQDLDRLMLSLLDRWAAEMRYIVMVGDPDQCQPEGTLIRTTAGDVPIERLDPAKHRLVSYDRHSAAIVGTQQGYAFEVSRRPYSGDLIGLRTVNHVSRSTPDHRWPVRWQQDARWNVTYLMRQGDRWRTGWCQLFNSGSFHLGQRARLERADEAWILGVYPTKAEASAAESIIASRYGIPTICFTPVAGSYMQDQAWIDHVFDSVGDRQDQARRLLRDHGRDEVYPFWSAADRGAKQGKRTPLVVRACNLIPEAMLVRDANGWTNFTTYRSRHDGDVYSLSVRPHELYWSDGLLTHNCLYEWRGSDPNLIHHGYTAIRTLSQSYRVPQAVHAAAVQWIEETPGRVPIEYYPTEHPGEVEDGSYLRSSEPRGVIDAAEEYAAQGTVMILAQSRYPIAGLVKEMRRRGLPFHNPYRTKNGQWNPLGQHRRGAISTAARVLAFCAPNSAILGEVGRPWRGRDVVQWAPMIRAKGVIASGHKVRLETIPDEAEWPAVMRVLEDAIEPDALLPLLRADPDWLERHAVDTYASRIEYPAAVMAAHGARALRETPRIIIGTIHSVKGGEADTVLLMPDLTPAAFTEFEGGGDGEAGVRRLFYVGMTRARHRLVLCGARPRQYAVQWG